MERPPPRHRLHPLHPRLLNPRHHHHLQTLLMTTEQQIKQRIINIITAPGTKIRIVRYNSLRRFIIRQGKIDLQISLYGHPCKVGCVEIYRVYLWGLSKRVIKTIWIDSERVSSMWQHLLEEKEAEEEKQKAEREEEINRALLALLNTKP